MKLVNISFSFLKTEGKIFLYLREGATMSKQYDVAHLIELGRIDSDNV